MAGDLRLRCLQRVDQLANAQLLDSGEQGHAAQADRIGQGSHDGERCFHGLHMRWIKYALKRIFMPMSTAFLRARGPQDRLFETVRLVRAGENVDPGHGPDRSRETDQRDRKRHNMSSAAGRCPRPGRGAHANALLPRHPTPIPSASFTRRRSRRVQAAPPRHSVRRVRELFLTQPRITLRQACRPRRQRSSFGVSDVCLVFVIAGFPPWLLRGGRESAPLACIGRIAILPADTKAVGAHRSRPPQRSAPPFRRAGRDEMCTGGAGLFAERLVAEPQRGLRQRSKGGGSAARVCAAATTGRAPQPLRRTTCRRAIMPRPWPVPWPAGSQVGTRHAHPRGVRAARHPEASYRGFPTAASSSASRSAHGPRFGPEVAHQRRARRLRRACSAARRETRTQNPP